MQEDNRDLVGRVMSANVVNESRLPRHSRACASWRAPPPSCAPLTPPALRAAALQGRLAEAQLEVKEAEQQRRQREQEAAEAERQAGEIRDSLEHEKCVLAGRVSLGLPSHTAGCARSRRVLLAEAEAECREAEAAAKRHEAELKKKLEGIQVRDHSRPPTRACMSRAALTIQPLRAWQSEAERREAALREELRKQRDVLAGMNKDVEAMADIRDEHAALKSEAAALKRALVAQKAYSMHRTLAQTVRCCRHHCARVMRSLTVCVVCGFHSSANRYATAARRWTSCGRSASTCRARASACASAWCGPRPRAPSWRRVRCARTAHPHRRVTALTSTLPARQNWRS